MADESLAAEQELRVRRDRANARLGWIFGALAVLLFLLAIWKYRPL